jgi:hypothetical protein
MLADTFEGHVGVPHGHTARMALRTGVARPPCGIDAGIFQPGAAFMTCETVLYCVMELEWQGCSTTGAGLHHIMPAFRQLVIAPASHCS